jgi:hypothetical protein
MSETNNYVSLEELKQFAEYYNKQEGRKYPYSNQIVRCGIVTNDREKAIDYMKDKDIVYMRVNYDCIEWLLDNREKWIWRNWNEFFKGHRLYKLVIDKHTDKNVFEKIIAPMCSIYCCSVEII